MLTTTDNFTDCRPANGGLPAGSLGGSQVGSPESVAVSGSAPELPGPETQGAGGARVAVFSAADLGAVFNWRFLDADFCRVWVLKKLHPQGPGCPFCGAPTREGKAKASWFNFRRVRCHNCKRYYRSTQKTFLQGVVLKPGQIVMLAWAFSAGFRNSEAAKLAEVDKSTAAFWRVRLTLPEVVADDIEEGK